jgi:parvulin-like peptidyl-prolyl isomerase
MRRLFVASIFSLSLAGCAQSRSALTEDGATQKAPVALTPVPSLSDTINAGVGGPASTRTVLKDPSNPQWDGRYHPADTTTPGQLAASGSPGAASPAPAADRSQPAPAPLAADATLVPGATVGATPAAGSVRTTSTPPPAGSAGAIGQPAAPEQSASPGLEYAPPATLGLTPAPAGAAPSAGASIEPVAGRVGGIPLDPGATRSATTPEVSAASLPGPPDTQSMPAPAPVSPKGAAGGGRDPLLGPDPDLMPPIPDISEIKPPVKPSVGASPTAATARTPSGGAAATPPASNTAVKPADSPAALPLLNDAAAKPADGPTAVPAPNVAVPQPAPKTAAGPTGAPPVTPSLAPPAGLDPAPIDLAPAPAGSARPPADPAAKPATESDAGSATAPAAGSPAAEGDRSTSINHTERAEQLAALPPLEPAPPSSSVAVTAKARTPAPEPATTLRDAQVIRVSSLKPAKDGSTGPDSDRKAGKRKRLSLEPGIPLAKVGDEVITFHDLTIETKEVLKRFPELGEAYRSGEHRAEALQHLIELRKASLNNLIDRSLLVQEAKHVIASNKDTKLLDRIYEDADRVFRDTEVKALMRQYKAATEAELNEKLVKQGQSLEAKRLAFRQVALSESYLHDKLKDRIKVELPDLLKYYNEHVSEHVFDRPAQITWREIVIDVAKHKSPDAAHQKAKSLLERLSKGEDFAALASTESDGPARSKKQGGLMQTSPEGYGVAAVNAALKSLPIGQVSGVIAGPDSFHVVRVDARRPAGSASFAEVYEQIRPMLADAKYRSERTAYIAKIKSRTPIYRYKAVGALAD